MICTCSPGPHVPQPCPVHWPEFVLRSVEAGAAKSNAVVDQLARDRETIATAALDAMKDLIIGALDTDEQRGAVRLRWAIFAPAAVERVTVQAASVTVVDDRGPGSTVDLVDERTPQTTTPPD